MFPLHENSKVDVKVYIYYEGQYWPLQPQKTQKEGSTVFLTARKELLMRVFLTFSPIPVH